MPSSLIFDLETVPDTDTGRRLLGLGTEVSDADVSLAMGEAALKKTDGRTSFVALPLHKIVAISAVFHSPDKLWVGSFGKAESSEADLIRGFFKSVEEHRPTLVGWNSGGFDLPVLGYRALKHGITAKTYWNVEGDSKWSNYQDRYKGRHLDLMDTLGRFQGRASLDDIATLLGFPGKLGMDGSKVEAAWREGRIEEIRAYCEQDVLNTYLVYLRFELMRGNLTPEAFATDVTALREYLTTSNPTRFKEFLDAWE